MKGGMGDFEKSLGRSVQVLEPVAGSCYAIIG